MIGLEVATVASITVICYLLGMACKAIEKIPDKYIPIIVGTMGGIIGVVGWLTTGDIPAENWLSAIEVGIASGLASTGVNQIYKQLRFDDGQTIKLEGDSNDA